MPVTFTDKLKNTLWSIFKPFWPYCARLLRVLGVRPYGRHQPYLLGKLAIGKRGEDFRQYLLNTGFTLDPLAWVDDDEVFGLRLLNNFKYQVHLRLYENGEVHAHHELTPEYDEWGHLTDKDTSEPDQEFMKLLVGWVVPTSSNQGS